ncbi:hypothetical protein NC652_020460 [Populus alba x Populus x berolinensis]|nr:hypothetical protein NC652_020460 [Populus alba x Populus x berolinensis]
MLKNSVKLPSETTSYVPSPNLASVSVPPMYAAFSTPQGRKPRGEEKLDGSGSGPCGDLELFADVDSSVLDELLQTFKKESSIVVHTISIDLALLAGEKKEPCANTG